jgi:putative acetyltransferase
MERRAVMASGDLFEIESVETEKAFDELKSLFREYQTALNLDLCFQNFETELQGLSQMYGPPQGKAFIARQGGKAVGCVAVRGLEPGISEMKRLYVRPIARKTGLGRTLADLAVTTARDLGYAKMRLDTLASMAEAVRLYQAMGFREIDPYCPNPLESPIFMELDL